MIVKRKIVGKAAQLATAAAAVEEDSKQEIITHLELAREFGRFYRCCIVALGAGRKGGDLDSEYTDEGGYTSDGKPVTGHEALAIDAYDLAQTAFEYWCEWVQDATVVKGTESEENRQ
jgi:hypothetical protein